MSFAHRKNLESYSTSLFEVLDKVGASEYVRQTRRHAMTTQEILISITQNAVRYVEGFTHTFGSSAEGTSTPGLQSDIDTVVSSAEPVVVKRLEDAGESTVLLMIQDGNTPPGYTKLLRVEEKQLPRNNVTRNDDEALDIVGRPVMKNKSLIDAMTYDERNGPAGTTLNVEGLPPLDYVPAFRCNSWPSQAIQWLHKPRKNPVLSATVADDFKQFGFFVVPVGQPTSPERQLEWRLSFSLQERIMMSNLTPVQFKCYVVLKMTKHDFIKPVVKGKSLTSYHCKTCLLYTIESTTAAQWTPGTLILCLMKCMNTLVQWLTEGFIPNYFIPEENMWKGTRKSRLQAAGILKGLLSDSPEFLTRIACDSTGDLFQLSMNGTDCVQTSSSAVRVEESRSRVFSNDSSTECQRSEGVLGEDLDDDDFIVDTIIEALTMEGDNKTKLEELKQMFPGADKMIENIAISLENDQSVQSTSDTESVSSGTKRQNSSTENVHVFEEEQRKQDVSLYKWHYWALDYIIRSSKELIETTVDVYNLDLCIENHRELLTWLANISHFRPKMEFSKLDFQIIKEYIFPFIYTSLGSQLAAKSMTVNETDSGKHSNEESQRLLEMGHTSDALSGRIKHAAILFIQGHYATAENILNEIDEQLEQHVTSWGRCYRKTDYIHEDLCNRMRDMRLSTREILLESVAACVMYLPTEMDLVPKELQYEMFRSTFAKTTRNKHEELWFDFAVIDAKVYMYFLLYKIYQCLGDTRSQNAKMLFLIMTLEHELNLGHPETANNVLGCMLKQQGYLYAAWNCFLDSWKLRPDHNAAKWHMCIMVVEAVAEMSKLQAVPKSQIVESTDGVEILYQRVCQLHYCLTPSGLPCANS